MNKPAVHIVRKRKLNKDVVQETVFVPPKPGKITRQELGETVKPLKTGE